MTRTLLLLHGGGVASWMWRPLIEHLGEGWIAIAPDLPGHGANAAEPYRSHDETVDALISLIGERATGPVSVVGFSLGAQLAVLLASRRPDLVERVTVISAQAKPSSWPTATLALLGMAAPLARNERFARAQAKELFVPPALFAEYFENSQAISKETLLAAVGENIRFTVPEAWGSFPGEALILVGERERRIMHESARLLAESRPGDELEIVEGCGHGIPLQRPEWLARRLAA